MAPGLIAALLLVATTAAYQPPRTPDGRPDLQGDWTNYSLTELERRKFFDRLAPSEDKVAAFEEMMNDNAKRAAYRAERLKKAGLPIPPDVGQADTEWFEFAHLDRIAGQPRSGYLTYPENGELPYLAAETAKLDAEDKLWARHFDNPEERGVFERCLMTNALGPPLGNEGSNANYRIVQTADTVAIESETVHDVRLIRIGARRGGAPEWMGDSVGAWQGDTLRVETTNFPAAYGEALGLDFLLSPKAVVTEWFTRTAPGEILYRFQVDDPATYTRPWRGEMALHAGKPLNEYACHEGNYALAGILAGARKWESEGRTPEPLDGGDPPPKPAPAAASAPAAPGP